MSMIEAKRDEGRKQRETVKVAPVVQLADVLVARHRQMDTKYGPNAVQTERTEFVGMTVEKARAAAKQYSDRGYVVDVDIYAVADSGAKHRLNRATFRNGAGWTFLLWDREAQDYIVQTD